MAGIGDIVQKAFYLGIGAASLAADKAGTQLSDLRKQAQKLADEMVERGEMTADEAKTFVSDILKQNESKQAEAAEAAHSDTSGPRKIDIDDGADTNATSNSPVADDEALDLSPAARLRQEVSDLQAELERLRSQ
ncbi:MAG: hypothetical protein AAF704_00870 [Cyanobacteria bacterium P01_D01_bin.123]